MSGRVIWFTGPSGSGKTTVATLVAEQLNSSGRRTAIIDGDVLRRGISHRLGFTRTACEENVNRAAIIAAALASDGIYVCVAVIAPYDEGRQKARALSSSLSLVYCYVPLDVLERRDTKGLYEAARRGEVKGLAGYNAPYEEPRDADVVLETYGSVTPLASAHSVFRVVMR